MRRGDCTASCGARMLTSQLTNHFQSTRHRALDTARHEDARIRTLNRASDIIREARPGALHRNRTHAITRSLRTPNRMRDRKKKSPASPRTCGACSAIAGGDGGRRPPKDNFVKNQCVTLTSDGRFVPSLARIVLRHWEAGKAALPSVGALKPHRDATVSACRGSPPPCTRPPRMFVMGKAEP